MILDNEHDCPIPSRGSLGWTKKLPELTLHYWLLALLELSLGGFWTIIGTINRVSVQKWQNNDNVTMNVLYYSADPIKITD